MSVELMIICHDDTFDPLETFDEVADAVVVALQLWREVENPFFVIREERTGKIRATLMWFWMDPNRVILSRCDGTQELILLPKLVQADAHGGKDAKREPMIGLVDQRGPVEDALHHAPDAEVGGPQGAPGADVAGGVERAAGERPSVGEGEEPSVLLSVDEEIVLRGP